MYRHLSRAPSRTFSGHVCLSCRRTFASTTRRNNGAADDWLSNFNDLSVSSETITRKEKRARGKEFEQQSPANPPQEEADVQDVKAALERKQHLSRKDRKTLEWIRRSEKKSSDDTSSGALEGIPSKVEIPGQASQHVRETYESVLRDLIAETGQSEEAKVKSLEDLIIETSSKKTDAEKAKLLEDLLSETETEKKSAAVNGEDPAVGGAKIRRCVSDNGFDWPGASRLPVSGGHQSGGLHDPSKEQPSPVDDVNVDSGVVSSTARNTHNTQGDLTGQPMSIIARARAVRDRPKWGGMTTEPVNTARPSKASFDSLRRADKVSTPPERPSTATSAKPWGFISQDAPPGFAISPGDLAISQDSNHARHNDEADSSASGSFRGLLGFNRLRSMLYGNDDSGEKVGSSPQHPAKEQEKSLLNQLNNVETGGKTGGEADTKIREIEAQTDQLESQSAESNGQDDDSSSVSVPPEEGSSSKPEPPVLRSRTLRRQRARHRRKERAAAAQELKRESPTNLKEVNPFESSQPATTEKITDSPGQSLSDALVGRQLSDAMGSPEGAAAEEYVDESDPGLPVISAKELNIKALNVEQPPVPGLSYGLDRVLFNPGVTSLQDQHSRVYNFDPYLQHIMPVEEFDFNALQEYKTSSQDAMLSRIAKDHSKKYVGSTSSMTSTLSHFHYLLSEWRDLNHGMLSRQFPADRATFTAINRAPTAIFLRWKNGTYAIDADKEHDSGNILMMLGKSMEKLLTLNKSDYERYRKSDPRVISEEERNLPEAYEYTTMGDFLMRSQLDAYDSRLPGTGMFDIKTRAIASIRMSTDDYKPMLGYEILTNQGEWQSYEREYYDMTRSTMLKYMLQARMGRMDGIFLAYHNVQRMFGFQYMPISEIDRVIHGQNDRCLGDQEFKLSLDLLNKVLEQATAKFPNKSLRFHFETRASPVTAMYIFAEPMEEDQIDEIQSKSKAKIAEFERKMMGIEAKTEPTKDKSSSSSSSSSSSPTTETEEDTPPSRPSPSSTTSTTYDNTSAHSPIYAATLLTGSRINNHRVERPTNLKPTDVWSVEYLLKEMESPADAWATYAQTKDRRRKALSRAVTTDDEGGAEATDEDFEAPNREMHEADGTLRKFEGDYFLEMLRRLAEEGREFRAKMDKVDRDRGERKVVFGMDAQEQGEGGGGGKVVEADADAVEAGIRGVEDYMAWMYRDRDRKQ